MASKQVVNSFQEGMKQDTDILLSNNKSYRYSMGGRLIFNKNGTYSWEIENGNKLSFTMLPRGGVDTSHYIPLGHAGNSSIRIIFSVSSISGAGEIGIFSLNDDGVGSYKTLFNDQDDPNGDTFDFNPNNQIEARFTYENDSTIRVYFVDGVENDSNQPRVFTFKYDRTIGNSSDIAAYSAVSLSVHSINSQAEFDMGLIKYDKRVNGNLLTGVYQYTYSLGTVDGYDTPWYPLTRKVFVTSDEVSNTNWNTYEMEGAGITSSKGNRIEIKGIDQKFTKIRVAYVYSKTKDTNDSASIFSQTEISGATMSFDHVSNKGEPLLIEEIPAIFSGIRAAKTLNIKDSTLYYGNLVEGILSDYNTETILSGLTVKPIFRDMRSDTKNYDNTEAIINPPVTHQSSSTETTTIRLHQGGTETYNIDADYKNYKGTQVEHLYTGYFRGETYRFAIVFYDKLGYPSFAAHLCDIKFPEQSSDTFTANRITALDTVVNVAAGGGVLPTRAWPTNNYGNYTSPPVVDGENTGAGNYSHIRIMGLQVDGIDASTISQQISGFKIIRTELDATILTQGLAYPSVKEVNTSAPLPLYFQNWIDATTGAAMGAGTLEGDIALKGVNMSNSITNTISTGTTPKFLVRPNLTTMYLPDYDFDANNLPTIQSQDKLKLVGGCFSQNATKSGVPNIWGGFQLTGNSDTQQYVKKMYYSANSFHDAPSQPYPIYLSEASPTAIWATGLGGEVPDYESGLLLANRVEWEGATWPPSANEYKGWGKPQTVFFKTTNFGSQTVGGSPFYSVNSLGPVLYGDYMGNWICNYIRPNANPYGGLTLSALETSIFYGTGHFQPVNNSSFVTPAGAVFNEIEVWGGDCYLDYFGFARVYSRMDGTFTSPEYDYAEGVVFPWESKLNHTLRQAASQDNPMYTDVGTRSWYEYLNGGTNWPKGIFHFDADNQLIEEFNIADSLQFQELIQFYAPKPLNFADNTRFPTRWRYTREKIIGDPIDTWRLFQVNDFYDLKGEYGEITSSLYIFNQIYSWQLSAFGRLRASDRAIIESANAGTLTTGVGDKLDGIDYISEIEGNQHQWSLFSSGKAAYWINVDMKSIMRFAQDGRVSLSDTYGIHDFSDKLGMFTNIDNPTYLGGIIGVFDHDNGDAIWSLNYDEYKLVISQLDVNSVIIDDKDIYKNNETLFIDWIGPTTPGVGLLFSEGKTILGENHSAVNYICAKSTSNDFWMNTVSPDGTITPVLLIEAGSCYIAFRNSNTEPWQCALTKSESVVSPEPFSFSFNENLNVFQGFHPYKASFMMAHNDNVLSYDIDNSLIDNEIYVHNYPHTKNMFYGKEYKAILASVVSEAPMLQKIFDALRVNCNEEASDTMITYLMETETQSYYFDVETDTRKKYLEDILRFPIRTQIQKDRTRGKHLKMTFEFLNNSYKSVRMTNLVTWFRNSNRI
jgi:hypothetical protein